MGGRWRGLLRSRGGNAATEFALVVPALLLLIGGVVEFGRAFQVWNAVNRLATQYAIAWADCSDSPAGACQTELATYANTAAIGNIVPTLVTANVTLQMFQVRMAGSTPNVVYVYPSGGTLSSGQTAAAQAAFADKQSGVIVTLGYQHSLLFFSRVMGTYLNSKLAPSYTVTQLKS